MKKFVFAALAAVATTGLTACHNDESGTETKPFNISVLYNPQPMQTDTYKGGSTGLDSYMASYESENKAVGEALDKAFGKEHKLVIMATDSADMAKQLNAKITEAFGSISDAGWVGRHEVRALWEKEDHYAPNVMEQVWGNKEGTPIDEHSIDPNEHKDTDDYNWDERNMLRQGWPVHLKSNEFITGLSLDQIGPTNILNKRSNTTFAINQDLNEGANGKYIFLRANVVMTHNGELTHLILVKSEKGFIDNKTELEFEGRTYSMVGLYGKVPGGATEGTGLNGDCNEDAGGSWLFLFDTCDSTNLKGGKRNIKDIGTISERSYIMNDYKDGYDYLTSRYSDYYNQKTLESGEIRFVPMVILHKDGTLTKYNEVADFNHGAKGKWIFMILHTK